MNRRVPLSLALLLAGIGAAEAQDVKPYIMIDVDTSSSMLCNVCENALPSYDNTAECPAGDSSCATCDVQGCGNGIGDDGRLTKVRIAIADVVNSFGEVTFGLARFHQTPTAFACNDLCAIVAPSGGWSGAPSLCNGNDPGQGFNAADILMEFQEDNQTDLLEWVDGCDNWPTSDDCDPVTNLGGNTCAAGELCADCSTGCDKELRASGFTPVAGSLASVHDYIETVRQDDPASVCRPYGVILLADGFDNCIGDPEAEAAALCDVGVPTYSIGFGSCPLGCDDPCFDDCPNSTCPTADISPPDGCFDGADQPALCIQDCPGGCQLFCQTTDIAVQGCGANCSVTSQGQQRCNGEPIIVEDETDLALAMAEIAQSSVLRELCNGLDDDCDGLTDEDFPGLGEECCDPCPGTIVCNATQDGTMCSGIGPPEVNCPEICDGMDNDCDLLVDEGIVCLPEVCDGFDNDGDGQTDEPPLFDTGLPCGSSEGECEMGVTCCQDAQIQCCGETAPKVEACNCLDDNCNTATDENVNRNCYNGPSSECPDPASGVCVGLCKPGTQPCDPSGCPTVAWGPCTGEVGPREEKCNCVDDDCDGLTDDGATCPGGVPCINCDCVTGCDPQDEFPCPAGFVCSGTCGEDPPHFCIPAPCNGVLCDVGEICEECTGECVSLCEGIDCQELLCCGGDCCETWEACEEITGGRVVCVDVSCTNEAFPCPSGQVCKNHECIEDPCSTVDCGPEEFCRDGECLATCPVCAPDEKCVDGRCVTDLCVDVVCQLENTVCCNGECINNPCVAEVECDAGEFCDPCTASCKVNLCPVTDCPEGFVCSRNECLPRAALGITEVAVSGAGGCSCRVADAPPPASSAPWLLLLGVGVLAGATRRRLGRWIGTALGLVLLVGVTGCEVRSLEFRDDVDASIADLGPDVAPNCVPIEELCNDFDDDCDGVIDNGNPEGGGPCGVGCDGDECTPIGECTLGEKTCLSGQIVCIGDVRPTAEECNGLDDSCDGETDEGFDFCNDISHCGGCSGPGGYGQQGECDIPNAIAKCVFDGCAGSCEGCARCDIDLCRSGWVDCEGDDPPNDCDCECSAAPGPEVCDGIDNDCNGLIDDGVTSPNFCRQLGACGGATPICQGAQGWCCNYNLGVVETYVPDPPVPCGFDVVAEEALCDDIDGDCDGGTDELFVDKGDPCADDGVGACQGIGTYVCTADALDTECVITTPGLSPTHEMCDGKDNDCDGMTDENTDGPSTCGGLCQGVSDAVNNIGTLRIYTYEASRPGSTSTTQGTPTNRACSVRNVLPWSSVTWAQADMACANAGMRLCSASEWQRACEGAGNFTWTYGDAYSDGADDDGDGDSDDGDECNGNDYDTVPGGVDQDNALATGALNSCVSQEGVFDMSGNLQEWTDDAVGAGHRARGGAFDDPGGGLECDNTFTVLPDNPAWIHPNTGFRCCCTIGVDCP